MKETQLEGFGQTVKEKKKTSIISGEAQTLTVSFAQVHKPPPLTHTHTHNLQFAIRPPLPPQPLRPGEGETPPSFCVGSPKFRPAMKAKFSMTRRRLRCRKRNQPELLGVLMNYRGLGRDNGLSGSVFFPCRIRHLGGSGDDSHRRPSGSERDRNSLPSAAARVCLSVCLPRVFARIKLSIYTQDNETRVSHKKREKDVFSEKK